MRKLTTFLMILLFVGSSYLTKSQNQVSKDGFFKSLSLDPVITLHNSSNLSVQCIFIDYKINGKELSYKFEGTLPAMTSVEIPLPRIQVQNGLHFFDASVSTTGGESLKSKTFAEGLSFTLSPGINASVGRNTKNNKQDVVTVDDSGCTCQNGDGLDEDISFWFSVYINDNNKIDAFGSTTQGKIWFQGNWKTHAGLENDWNQAVFKDSKNRNRSYLLTVSTDPVPESFTYYGDITNKNSGLELNTIKCSAYPNPFDQNINIRYILPEDAIVDIKITDLIGKLLAHPVQSLQHGKGSYTYEFGASNLATGVYHCIIQSGNYKEILKLIKK